MMLKLKFAPLHVNHPAIEMEVTNLSLDNSFKPNYSMEEVYGRMDPIAIYKNTQRSIGGKFDMWQAAGQQGMTTEDVVENFRQLNLLAQFLYPVYMQGDNTAVLKAPPFLSISYSSMVGAFYKGTEVSGETGFLTSLTYNTGDLSKDMASANIEGAGDDLYPYKVSVSFGFQVVHSGLVGWVDDKFSPGHYGESFPFRVGESSTPSDAVPSQTGGAPGSATNKVANAQNQTALK